LDVRGDYLKLLEMMDCGYVSAVFSGDKEADNKANTGFLIVKRIILK